MNETRIETVNATKTSSLKRISWGAIFAGLVVALVTQLLLSVLGVGIGASTINPVSEDNPVTGIGLGAGIWFFVSTLLALFAGGWVAGRLAGLARKTDSALHGVLTWGSATLVTFFLLTKAAIWTFVIFLFGGVAAAVGGTMGAPREWVTTSRTTRPVGMEVSPQP